MGSSSLCGNGDDGSGVSLMVLKGSVGVVGEENVEVSTKLGCASKVRMSGGFGSRCNNASLPDWIVVNACSTSEILVIFAWIVEMSFLTPAWNASSLASNALVYEHNTSSSLAVTMSVRVRGSDTKY